MAEVATIKIDRTCARWGEGIKRSLAASEMDWEGLHNLSMFLTDLRSDFDREIETINQYLDLARSVSGFLRDFGDRDRSTYFAFAVVDLLLNDNRNPRSIVVEQFLFLRREAGEASAENFLSSVKQKCLDRGFSKEQVNSLDEVRG